MYSCRHRSTTLTSCIVYACIVSSGFVFNLYNKFLVPRDVLMLPRSNVRQIKWRFFSVTVTLLCSVALYPFFFCHKNTGDMLSDHDGLTTQSLAENLEWGFDVWALAPLFHTMILYIGPLVTTLLQHRLYYLRNSLRYSDCSTTFTSFMTQRLRQTIKVTFQQNPWTAARDLCVAPFAEEAIFRACIIPPFMHSHQYISGNISLLTICWVTPLFFGTAHLHHALQQWRQGIHMKTALFISMFQFLYTTLFGCYASYCFIKTGSLLGVVLLHAFCNFMGLPNVGFLFGSSNSGSDEHSDVARWYRIVSICAYIVGIVGFWMCFLWGSRVTRLHNSSSDS